MSFNHGSSVEAETGVVVIAIYDEKHGVSHTTMSPDEADAFADALHQAADDVRDGDE